MNFQKSPMLDAVDLVRIDADNLTLDELVNLSHRVIKTLFALHELRNQKTRKSANQSLALNFRLEKLEAYNVRLVGLIEMAEFIAAHNATLNQHELGLPTLMKPRHR